MATKRPKLEEIVVKLRQVEVLMGLLKMVRGQSKTTLNFRSPENFSFLFYVLPKESG